ncbi:MAG TPA: hypothetical protein VMP01_25060 [Pirellulaceae bacterium]|nr:hypothetical protein [Pirellulaceae bacterium]
MRRLIVHTDSPNTLGLRELCQRYCEERRVADNLTAEQAAESVSAWIPSISLLCGAGSNPAQALSG